MKQLREQVLWWAADRRLRHDKPFIIAIGGAMAKTSTKDAVGAVMNRAFPGQVLVSYGNLNTYLGVPLAVLGFKINFHKQDLGILRWSMLLIQALWRGLTAHLPKYVVVELGTDQPGDIPALTRHFQPDIAMITIVGPAHVENYPSMQAVAEEESSLLRAVKLNGIGVVNAADQYLTLHRKNFQGKLEIIDCPLERIAEQYAYFIGKHFGLEESLITQALSVLVRPEHRFNRKKIGNLLVIDDSYNANPLSMKAALNILKKMPGRRVAILGSMKELGAEEVIMHQQIGELARTVADELISVGELAKEYGGVVHFADSQSAATGIFPYIQEGDSILIKGSRSVKMEKIVESLEQHYGHR